MAKRKHDDNMIINDEDYNDNDDDNDWIPDSIQAKQRKEKQRIFAEKLITITSQASSSTILSSHDKEPTTSFTTATKARKKRQLPKNHRATSVKPQQQQQQQNEYVEQSQSTPNINNTNVKSPYTEEEDEIINALGGRTLHPQRKRQDGYIGDCTLSDIALDYSIPISYLADVLCTWGVPIPINVHDRIGDIITGEQVFAILEAIYTIDIAILQDRYSNYNLYQLCYEYNIPIQDAFEMCLKEGYNLPFGIQTHLRIEQEHEIIRVLCSPDQYQSSIINPDDDDYY